MPSQPARYDAIADWYVEFTKDWDSQPLALLPTDLEGLRVMDLACGYGTASRYLAQRGAQVTGLDISAGLLSRARQLEASQPLGIRYIHGDAASTDWWDGCWEPASQCEIAGHESTRGWERWIVRCMTAWAESTPSRQSCEPL